MCNTVTFSTCLSKKSVNKKSLDHYTMRFWWLPINAVSNEKIFNFQLKSENSSIQIPSRGGMTEKFRHKIIIWIVCGKGIEIWCFSLYCVDVCKRLYCDNNLAGYTLSFIALVVAITIYLSLRYFARYSQTLSEDIKNLPPPPSPTPQNFSWPERCAASGTRSTLVSSLRSASLRSTGSSLSLGPVW